MNKNKNKKHKKDVKNRHYNSLLKTKIQRQFQCILKKCLFQFFTAFKFYKKNASKNTTFFKYNVTVSLPTQ